MENKKLFYLIVAFQVVFLLGMIALKQSAIFFGERVILKTVPIDPVDFFRGDYIHIRYEISTINPDMVKNDKKGFARGEPIYVRLQKVGDYWNASEISHSKTQGLYIKGTVNQITRKILYTIKDSNSSVYTYEDYSYYYNPNQNFQIGDIVEYQIYNGNVNQVYNGNISYPAKCSNGVCANSKSFKESGLFNDPNQNPYHEGTIIKVKNDLTELSIGYPVDSYYVPRGEGNIAQTRSNQVRVEVAIWHGDAIATNILMDGKKIDFR